jgi:ATP phosphoribosyltransferase regulatory subunit
MLPYGDRILFDFSVVNNMSYYNGIVFTGFLKGISGNIIAGGQYGKLMQMLNRTADAIGFAVYLDLLEQLPQATESYDVDVLVLYSRNTPPENVINAVSRIRSEGCTVSAQKAIPEKLRWREMIQL